jgi:hypothetical protein
MSWWHYATVLGGAFLTVAPQFLQALPPEWRDLATALVAVVVAAVHLFMSPPPVKQV